MVYIQHHKYSQNIFSVYPILQEIKTQIYDLGAVYAAMSGSGSTIYGIFDNLPDDTTCFDECFYKKTVPLQTTKKTQTFL